MVGQWTATKPSRSDEVLDSDRQQRITNQVRAQFDSMVPKRPTKPNRSEPDLTSSNPPSDVAQNIPELDKLRSLQSQSQVKISEGGATVEQEEFVETQYYREMNSIDKQHHTTGSGFIRVMKEGGEGNGYDIQLESGQGAISKPIFKSNPATNDWIPTLEDDEVLKEASRLYAASWVRDIGPDLRPNDYKKDDGTEGKSNGDKSRSTEIEPSTLDDIDHGDALKSFIEGYRDALKSFIEGYQEGIQQIMEKKEYSSKAQQEGNTDKNST